MAPRRRITPRAIVLAGLACCLSTLYVFRGASDEGRLKDEGEPGRVPPEPELKTLVVDLCQTHVWSQDAKLSIREASTQGKRSDTFVVSASWFSSASPPRKQHVKLHSEDVDSTKRLELVDSNSAA